MLPAAAAIKMGMRGEKRNRYLFSCQAFGVFIGKRRRETKRRKRMKTKPMSPLEFKMDCSRIPEGSGEGKQQGNKGHRRLFQLFTVFEKTVDK